MQHMLTYIVCFGSAFLLAVAGTFAMRKIARKLGAIDVPNDPRKIHTKPTPLLGGWAIFAAFALTTFGYLAVQHPDARIVPLRFFMAALAGGLVLMAGGFLDDKYGLPPKYSFIAPAVASLIVVSSGIGVGITRLTNPFGSQFNLGFHVLGLPFSAIVVFVFILGMTYTTKFLDGMDGLASGISLIASLTLCFISLTPKINQPITASLAIALAGALGGFLVFNFNPASIFLGESGSTFAGFMLGTLSVFLGGKIATAILVMGIPILDIAWVIVRRIWYGGSPFKADRKHLHLRLLDIGFSQRQTALILYAIAICFGGTAIILQSLGKLVALVVLMVVMVLLGLFSVFAFKAREERRALK